MGSQLNIITMEGPLIGKFIGFFSFTFFIYYGANNDLLWNRPELLQSYNYIDEVKTIQQKSPGVPIVITFTNMAASNFVKAFICNIMQLNDNLLTKQFVVITSDRDTLQMLQTFSPNITVVLRPLRT